MKLLFQRHFQQFIFFFLIPIQQLFPLIFGVDFQVTNFYQDVKVLSALPQHLKFVSGHDRLEDLVDEWVGEGVLVVLDAPVLLCLST